MKYRLVSVRSSLPLALLGWSLLLPAVAHAGDSHEAKQHARTASPKQDKDGDEDESCHPKKGDKGMWPTYGQNSKRTFRADGRASARAPRVLGSYNLGARLSASDALVTPPLSNIGRLVVHRHGGLFVATDSSGTRRWARSAPSDWTLSGSFDVDGDGIPEVVVTHAGGAHILRGDSGATVTTIDGFVGVPSASWIATDSGGVLALVRPHGRAAAFSFLSNSAAPTLLWDVADTGAWPSRLLSLDGAPGVALWPTDRGLRTVDVRTGHTRSEAPIGTDPFGVTLHTHVGPGGALLAVAWDASALYSAGSGTWAFQSDSSGLLPLWNVSFSDSVPGLHDARSVHGSVADFNQDGVLDVAFSVWDGSTGAFATHVAEAFTGRVLATLPSRLLVAVVPDSHGSLLVTRDGATFGPETRHATLQGYQLFAHGLSPVGSAISNARVLMQTAPSSSQSLGLPVPAVLGSRVLVATRGESELVDDMVGWLSSDGSFRAAYAVPKATSANVVWTGSDLWTTDIREGVVMFHEDGSLRVLDGNLEPRAASRAGSYSAEPRVMAGKGGGGRIVAMTASGALDSVDGATLMKGRSALAFRVGAALGERDPVFDLGGQSVRYATVVRGTTGHSVVGLDRSGNSVWSHALPVGIKVRSPGGYVIAREGESHADLLLPLSDASEAPRLLRIDGRSGARVEETILPAAVPGADMLGLGALADANGDGHADLIVPIHDIGVVALSLRVGTLGAPIWSNRTPRWNIGGISVGPLENARKEDVLRFQAPYGSGPLFRFDLATGALETEAPTDYVWGESITSAPTWVARRTGGFDLVDTGSTPSTGGRVRRLQGNSLQSTWTRYLDAGRASDTAAPSPRAILTSPVTVSIKGRPHGEMVVVGSDDGHLYALRAEDGALLWSVNLGQPVRHVIAANVDPDDDLEFVVSVASGELLVLGDARGHSGHD